MGVSLDKDLLRSCVTAKASRACYQAYLNDTAKAKATDESTRKRKSVVDEIDELKSKRRQLECDLTELLKSADTYSVRAEGERNFSLVAKSNAVDLQFIKLLLSAKSTILNNLAVDPI